MASIRKRPPRTPGGTVSYQVRYRDPAGVQRSESFPRQDKAKAFKVGKYLTTQELAEYLTVPINTIYQWRHRGTGPRASRVGKHLRWKLTEVDRWVEQHASSGSR